MSTVRTCSVLFSFVRQQSAWETLRASQAERCSEINKQTVLKSQYWKKSSTGGFSWRVLVVLVLIGTPPPLLQNPTRCVRPDRPARSSSRSIQEDKRWREREAAFFFTAKLRPAKFRSPAVGARRWLAVGTLGLSYLHKTVVRARGSSS